ncbi:DUF3949 domain-containing protein [Halonatronum saccharophilum]|uniref:DUF3949 domain-containing protein n=1 Tax=Halonatronum saccharophilum TaxID=150060 RepID=UPI0004883E29|nr:DUF3949 domain-containing protein [Halonatronum saccharophilum]
MDLILIISVTGLIIITGLGFIVKLQYDYIEGMEEKRNKLGLSQGEMNERATLQEDVNNYFMRANPLIAISGFIAWLIYEFKKRRK